MLKVGEKIPFFKLVSDSGEEISSESLIGKKTVIYFYPRSNTPGCTKEAQSFQRVNERLTSNGIRVIGISPDKSAAQLKFKEKYDFPFSLLSDSDKQAVESFGVWGEKKMCGKTSMGVIRTTFVIDEDGTVIKVFDKVKTNEHGEEVAEYLGV